LKIAVLGSGNGGCAVAFDWAIHGHSVNLFDFEAFSGNIKTIQKIGGIHAEGELEGFASIKYAGHDIKKTLDYADVIFAVGPAYSTKPFAEICKPHLKKGQTIIVCPSSCGGSIEFKKEAGLGIRDENIIVAETSTLPYAVRIIEPGRIKVFLKLRGGIFLAALPAKNTTKVLEKIQAIYPMMKAAKNVLQTSLQNSNPVIHPPITLLNVALIERTKGNFFFYQDGVTTAVGKLIAAVDRERLAIGEELGIKVIPDSELGCMQGYMTEMNYDTGYSKAPGFKDIKAPTTLDYRYFNEDVGYGLVFMQKLGEQIGVETPYMSAIIKLVSLLMGRDYLREAKRTMESLGLSGYTPQELLGLLA